MSKLSLPQRGQPLDLSYLYDIAKVVNELSSQISPSTSKTVTIDTVSAGTQTIKTSEAKIIGGYIEVYNNTNVSTGSEKSFVYNFSDDYKYAPIVTATPVNVGNTSAGKNVSVVIKSITTSKVEGYITVNASGDVTIGVNLLIIGVPN
jgi:hypothetical protein